MAIGISIYDYPLRFTHNQDTFSKKNTDTSQICSGLNYQNISETRYKNSHVSGSKKSKSRVTFFPPPYHLLSTPAQSRGIARMEYRVFLITDRASNEGEREREKLLLLAGTESVRPSSPLRNAYRRWVYSHTRDGNLS